MSKQALIVIVVLAVLASLAFEARADGLLVGPSQLSKQDRLELQTHLQHARSAHPKAFAQLAELRSSLALMDARKRGPYPVLTPKLHGLGPAGLMPMLERLAVKRTDQGGLSRATWRGWQASLVEAVGKRRDRRAEPVLRAILEHGPTDYLIVQAAAGAYGKLVTDPVAAKLVSLSKVPGDRQLAILSGMSHCRRTVVASRLAEVLDQVPDVAVARVLARSLARVGSAWAWKVPTAPHSAEEDAVRLTAAESLVRAFPTYGPEVRGMLTKAILVVDHPDTLAMIEAAKSGAASEARSALDELAQRFQHSPFH
ncbi:MAG: hypothetical protein JRI68_05690 [Deltaproteobacteria bacterium]|nr:hypothetical protein [Deltaproteobacteria bacterium]